MKLLTLVLIRKKTEEEDNPPHTAYDSFLAKAAEYAKLKQLTEDGRFRISRK